MDMRALNEGMSRQVIEQETPEERRVADGWWYLAENLSVLAGLDALELYT